MSRPEEGLLAVFRLRNRRKPWPRLRFCDEQ
jgi:hypothetical protein